MQLTCTIPQGNRSRRPSKDQSRPSGRTVDIKFPKVSNMTEGGEGEHTLQAFFQPFSRLTTELSVEKLIYLTL
jgi:hypothetical protein